MEKTCYESRVDQNLTVEYCNSLQTTQARKGISKGVNCEGRRAAGDRATFVQARLRPSPTFADEMRAQDRPCSQSVLASQRTCTLYCWSKLLVQGSPDPELMIRMLSMPETLPGRSLALRAGRIARNLRRLASLVARPH